MDLPIVLRLLKQSNETHTHTHTHHTHTHHTHARTHTHTPHTRTHAHTHSSRVSDMGWSTAAGARLSQTTDICSKATTHWTSSCQEVSETHCVVLIEQIRALLLSVLVDRLSYSELFIYNWHLWRLALMQRWLWLRDCFCTQTVHLGPL